MESQNNSLKDFENKRKSTTDKYRLKYKAIRESMKPLQKTIINYLNKNVIINE
jgi:hypothetical protein